MAAPRIHTGQTLVEGAEVQLEEGPSRHLTGALRLRAGARITLFNGAGGEYEAVIATASRKRVQLKIHQHRAVERESPLQVALGIAVSRGERMDWIIRKSTELGVHEISPLFSERTEVRLNAERADKKLGHWRQIAISACEQCGRNRIPDIHGLQPLAEWTEKARDECKLVLHPRAAASLRRTERPAGVALLIGPEGGLSDDEIARAEAAGFAALALGPRVLRTETAPLAALSILQHHWGDME